VLVGIKRLQMFNRVDPEEFYSLATAYYDFDNDPTLRAAVLFGRGDNLSRANNVGALSALAKDGKSFSGRGSTRSSREDGKALKFSWCMVTRETCVTSFISSLLSGLRARGRAVRCGRKRTRPRPRHCGGPLLSRGRLGKCHAICLPGSLGCADGV
jgi:hypothetical protein